MPKKLLKKEIEGIINGFLNGKNIEELAKEHNCTKITINRHLKKNIDEKEYNLTILQNKEKKEILGNENRERSSHNFDEKSHNSKDFVNSFPELSFVEIVPLDYEIDNIPRKDLSSIPISKVDFPKVVYMLIDKKIELEIKYLKEYPDWQFLPQEELDRKTIQIFIDLKVAKRFCNANQKVLKVPNSDVFRIVAPLLLEKGISRIVSEDKLISL